jgi:ribose transport system substrate-binding protein
MKIRMLKVLLVLIALTTLISGCSQAGTTLLKDTAEATPSVNEQEHQFKVALVMKTLTNPFFVDMEKGARIAESELNIQLIVKTGAQETSIEQQIQIVEDLIQQSVDAIVIAPGSSVDLVQVLKKAQDAGMVIVNIDNRLDAAECEKQGLTGVPFISVKNDDAAYLSARAIASLVTEPTEAVIIEGIRDADNAELRRQGVLRAFQENSNINIVASESANWKIDEAHDLAQSLFTIHPHIGLIFCANDMMALGVIRYLEETGRCDVLVAGFDNLEDMRDAIKEGWAYATIDQQADIQGYTGIVTAVKMLKGQTVEEAVYVDAEVITKDELDS